MFDSLTNSAIVYGPVTIISNLLLAFVLALIIAFVYKKTHRGLSYSQTFVMTLIISGVVIASVMMVIGNNVALAFGAFGAFSLIRFRTAIKDAKDMGFIFLVLAVGMAAGTSNYLIAVLTTVIVLLIVITLTKMKFGSIRHLDYILTLKIDSRKASENGYKNLFDKYLKSNNLLNIKAIDEGHILQMSFSVKFLSEKETDTFTSELEKLEEISNVNLITAKNDIEY